jgi:hypothetical protein
VVGKWQRFEIPEEHGRENAAHDRYVWRLKYALDQGNPFTQDPHIAATYSYFKRRINHPILQLQQVIFKFLLQIAFVLAKLTCSFAAE